MAFDCFVLANSLMEMKPLITGAKINKISQIDRHTLIIRYHNAHNNGKLLLCAHPQNGRLHLTESNFNNPQQPPLFCMVARKWLESSTLINVLQTPYERVAELQFRCRNDLGDSIICRLIIEIMGKHSNIILVNNGGIIIDGIHHYNSNLSRYREVLPGIPYIPPPPQQKTFPSLSEEQLAEVLLTDDNIALDQSVAAILPKHIAGISPLLAQNIVIESGLKPEINLNQLGQYEISRIAKCLQNLAHRYDTNDFSPTILYHEDMPIDFAAFPLVFWCSRNQKQADSINAAIDEHYSVLEHQQLFAKEKRELNKYLQKHISRLQKKIAAKEAELAASEAGDDYQKYGDLLAANLYYLRKGINQVELDDLFAPGKSLIIPLDPSLSPQENIKRYYYRCGKCKKANTIIKQQLDEDNQILSYLLSIAQSIEDSSSIEELAPIEDEMNALFNIRNKAIKPKQNNSQPLPPRQYLSQDGFAILIGRNNKQNDRLTLKQAAGSDIWLHAQKIPGSHVIIKSEGREVPITTIWQAASYAAWFSKAQSGNNVPVDYTLAAQVKKPNGAKPGMVIYFQQKTLYVEPVDPQTINETP